MALSQDQWERLLALTREHRPAIEISRWLRIECGLDFKESAEERARALKESGLTIFEQSELAQANLNVYRTKLEQEKKELTKARASKTREENKNRPLEHADVFTTAQPKLRPEIKDSCVSCGDESFACNCPVKILADIPF